MRLVDQLPAIGRAIEHGLLPPRWRERLVVAEHALPGRPRMRRLNQRICEVALLAFGIGELETRCVLTDASRRLRTHPAMHVVIERILTDTPEITAAACGECRSCESDK